MRAKHLHPHERKIHKIFRTGASQRPSSVWEERTQAIQNRCEQNIFICLKDLIICLVGETCTVSLGRSAPTRNVQGGGGNGILAVATTQARRSFRFEAERATREGILSFAKTCSYLICSLLLKYEKMCMIRLNSKISFLWRLLRIRKTQKEKLFFISNCLDASGRQIINQKSLIHWKTTNFQ